MSGAIGGVAFGGIQTTIKRTKQNRTETH